MKSAMILSLAGASAASKFAHIPTSYIYAHIPQCPSATPLMPCSAPTSKLASTTTRARVTARASPSQQEEWEVSQASPSPLACPEAASQVVSPCPLVELPEAALQEASPASQEAHPVVVHLRPLVASPAAFREARPTARQTAFPMSLVLALLSQLVVSPADLSQAVVSLASPAVTSPVVVALVVPQSLSPWTTSSLPPQRLR
jgi:hypothetical protein